MSPGASSSREISTKGSPPIGRRTEAWVRTMARSSAAAELARCSCTKASSTLSTTMAEMTMAERWSLIAKEAAASVSRRALRGLNT